MSQLVVKCQLPSAAWAMSLRLQWPARLAFMAEKAAAEAASRQMRLTCGPCRSDTRSIHRPGAGAGPAAGRIWVTLAAGGVASWQAARAASAARAATFQDARIGGRVLEPLSDTPG
jgi:hypothetical protein